jgi:dsDNA-specific endonuclease/ATPase MutS2
VAFRCDPRLWRLGGSACSCLAAQAATSRGAEALREGAFPSTHGSVRERLAETSEARALVDQGREPGFGGVADLRADLDELARGRTLHAGELAKLLAMLEAARRVRVARGAYRERPAPASPATLPDLRALSTRSPR